MGQSIVFKEDIEITEDYYKSMRRACTKDQHILFDEIFGKSNQFKVGEWVVGGFSYDENYSDKAWEIGKITDRYVHPKKDIISIVDYTDLRYATEEEIKEANYIPESTPCLAKNWINWLLAYSDGKGRFKTKDGAHIFSEVIVLDINNLPKY